MSKSWEVQQVVTDVGALERERVILDKYAANKESGYVEFYAERQDHIMRAQPLMWEQVDKSFQFQYLQKHGLTPDQRFLEYGCGTSSAGKHIIDFLDPQKYVGVDISAESIRIGWMILAKYELFKKGPVLHVIPGGDVAVLQDLKFDTIWAQSVFTHCPPDIVKQILNNLKPHINEGGRFYATIAQIDEGIIQMQFHNWAYTLEFFETAAPECGYDVEVMDDWVHPADYLTKGFSKDTLLRFTPR